MVCQNPGGVRKASAWGKGGSSNGRLVTYGGIDRMCKYINDNESQFLTVGEVSHKSGKGDIEINVDIYVHMCMCGCVHTYIHV